MGKKLRLVLVMALVLCMSTVFAACGSKTITSIAMDPDTMPNTTIGIDETFTIGEANKIIVTYDNGNSTKWSIAESMLTYSPEPDSGKAAWSKPQTVTVTVTYTRLGTTLTTTFDLHIIAEGEAGAVDAAIAALNIDELTYADLGEIDALLARYNRLTETEKTYVLNAQKLLDAKAKITELGTEVDSVVLTAPVTVEYRTGDVMNWSGCFATVTLVNGTATNVELTASNATVTGFDNENAGEGKTATITYNYLDRDYTVEYTYTMIDSNAEERAADVANYAALVEALPSVANLVYTDIAKVEEARAAYIAVAEKWEQKVYTTVGGVQTFDHYTSKYVNDTAIKALEAEIKRCNAKVDSITATFFANTASIRYTDRQQIADSRTAFDNIDENIREGWTGYVTDAQKKQLTDSEAVIVAMEKAIKDFKTEVAVLPEIAAFDYTEDSADYAALEKAYEDLHKLVNFTLNYDLSFTKNWSYTDRSTGRDVKYDYTFVWSLNGDRDAYVLTISGSDNHMSKAVEAAEEKTPTLYDTYSKQINAFVDAGILVDYNKIAALGVYPEIVSLDELLNSKLNGTAVDNVFTVEDWKNAVYIYALDNGSMPDLANTISVSYRNGSINYRSLIANSSMAGKFFTFENTVLRAAWDKLNATTVAILGNVNELAGYIDDVLDGEIAYDDLEIAPLDEGVADANVYAKRKAIISLLQLGNAESIYKIILNDKYEAAINAAVSACNTADALILNVQNAIKTATVEDVLSELTEVEELYNDLYTLKVSIGYKGTMTAESFFGINLKNEVDRTSLNELEVNFLKGLIASISENVKYDEQPVIQTIENGILSWKYLETGFIVRSEKNKEILVGFDALNDLNNFAVVDTLDRIATAKTQVEANITLVQDAIEDILAIGYVRLNTDSKDLVAAARNSYSLLINGWKQLVTAEHLETLIAAEKALVDLQAAVDAFNALELPAFAYQHYIRLVVEETEETTYAGAYADALAQYNALIEGHEEIVEQVAEQYAALTALIEKALTEYAKVDALNAAVEDFKPNYDASTAALRADLHAVHPQWKLEGLVNGYVIGQFHLGTVKKEETITALDEYDAIIKAENDAIAAFLAVEFAQPVTYTAYITPYELNETTSYANAYEAAKALYEVLTVYTCENHETVGLRNMALRSMFLEISLKQNMVKAVEEKIEALSVPYDLEEQGAISVAYDDYVALPHGWIEAVDETLATKIKDLHQKVDAVKKAIDDVKTMIAALPASADAMTYSDLPDITAARNAYNAIIVDSTNTITAQSIKDWIDDSKLVALEERATKLTDEAKKIQEQIDALNITTYASKNAIVAARAAYDAFVTNGQGFYVLIRTENLVNGEKYIADCDEASGEFLDCVKEMLPSEAEDLTLTQSKTIAHAYELYNDLDADIKENNEKVIAAKALVDACKAQDEANKALVEEFVERVEALPVSKVEDDPETEVVETGWNTDGIKKDNIDVYEKEVNALNEILATLKENKYVSLVKTPGDPENPDGATEDILWITDEILGKLAAATAKVEELLAPIQAILDEIEAIEKLTEENIVVDFANAASIMEIITTKFDVLTDAEKNTTIGKKIEAYRTSINAMTAKAEAYIEQDKTVVVDELDYTEASRNSVTALRSAYDELVDGWNEYTKPITTGEGEAATTDTISVSNENLLNAEAKIASFAAQLANAEALAEAIADKNFVLELTAAEEDGVATVAETDEILETVITYSDRAGIVTAYDAYKALADIAGLQQAFDADLRAELIRVMGLVTELDDAVGTEIAVEITKAFNPVYTKVTLGSLPTIDKFFIIIGEKAETESVKAFRNGWGAYLEVGYKTEYDLLQAALARYNALVEGEAKFKEMVHTLCDGKTSADVTYAMGEELTKIREYYKEMFVTDDDRATIRAFDEYKTLEAFESAWRLKYLEAKDVEKMIDDITSLDREAIEAAKTAYDKIVEEGKGFEKAIENYDKLVGYMDELEESYETPEAINNFLSRVNAADWTSFATVDYGTVSTFLTKVLPNFNSLTDEEKTGVITSNQEKLDGLKTAGEDLMAQLDEIRTTLKAVTVSGVDLDDAKGETGVLYLANKALEAVTATDADNTTAAANKTSWKNALRPELDTVELANAKIEEIKAAMTAFINAVNALPAKETLDFETAQDVFNAETLYNKLTDDAKADTDVVAAKAKLDDYLAYVNTKGYTSFAEAYAKAVSTFNDKFLNSSLKYSTATEQYFYLEAVALPSTFTDLKVGGVALTNEQISVMVGKTNELKAPAMKTVALADGKVRLSIALPVVATSLNSGNLVISYKDGGETFTKTLSAYTVAVGTNLSLKDAKEIGHVTGYESEVSKKGSSVAFSSQNGKVGIGLLVNNNSTAVSGVTCAFYTRKSTGSTEVTYGFTTYGKDGVEIYPEYSVGAVTSDFSDAKAYDIYLDGYGALTVSVAYTYYKKA